MNWRLQLLWIDGFAGLIVGVLVLSLAGLLSLWYHLPIDFMYFMGGVNLLYASYSLSLARRSTRSLRLIKILVGANITWAILCLVWVLVFRSSLSLLGWVHLIGEAFFVGGLAVLEWRNRDLLQTA